MRGSSGWKLDGRTQLRHSKSSQVSWGPGWHYILDAETNSQSTLGLVKVHVSSANILQGRKTALLPHSWVISEIRAFGDREKAIIPSYIFSPSSHRIEMWKRHPINGFGFLKLFMVARQIIWEQPLAHILWGPETRASQSPLEMSAGCPTPSRDASSSYSTLCTSPEASGSVELIKAALLMFSVDHLLFVYKSDHRGKGFLGLGVGGVCCPHSGPLSWLSKSSLPILALCGRLCGPTQRRHLACAAVSLFTFPDLNCDEPS